MSTSTNQKPMWQVSFGQATERCHVATSTLTFLDTSAPLRKCTRRLDRPHGGTAPPPLSPLCSRPHSAPNAPVVWTGLTVAPPAAVVAALLAASQRPRSASTIRPRPLRATPFRVRHPFAARFGPRRASCSPVPPRAMVVHLRGHSGAYVRQQMPWVNRRSPYSSPQAQEADGGRGRVLTISASALVYGAASTRGEKQRHPLSTIR